MKNTLLAIIFCLSMLSPAGTVGQVNSNDSLALVDLYNSTNGPNWSPSTNWLAPGTRVSHWDGVIVVGGRVKILYLSDQNLTGTIPSSIGNLTNLTLLELYNNQLTGSIPTSIENLTKLEIFDLNNNLLTGTIPAGIGNLTKLEILDLSTNQLEGTIPESLSLLSDLRYLDFNHNQLSGPLQSSYCDKSYIILGIDFNRFNFNALEPLNTCLNNTSIEYKSQALLPLTNNNPVLSVSAGGTLANNTYRWLKDGTEVALNTGDSTLTLTEPGIYKVEVSNALITDFLLVSEEVEITTILPLDFLSIRASECNDAVCLEWLTSNEQNTSHFELEVTTDGRNFSKLGANIPSSNTSGVHRYQTTDQNPAYGTNYYRIKQVDLDGTYQYSKTVAVTIGKTGVLLAVPNPTTGSFMIKGLDKAETVSVYNLNGQLLKQWQNIRGNRQFNISNLSSGIYIIKVNVKGKQTIHRIVKQQ